MAREDVPGLVQLVAYVLGEGADEAGLRADLGRELPAHMVPARIVPLTAFPLTPNKKVDRKALPMPPARGGAPVAVAKAAPVAEPAAPMPAAPGGDVDAEAAIAAVWQRLLGVASVQRSDNFFDLGGHSLLAVQAHRDIRAALGTTTLGITDIFRFPTLGALADRAGGGRAAPAAPPPRAARRAAPAPQAASVATSGEAASVDPGTARRREAMTRRREMRARRGGAR